MARILISISGNSVGSNVGAVGIDVEARLPLTFSKSAEPEIPARTVQKGSTLTANEIDANFRVLEKQIYNARLPQDGAVNVSSPFFDVIDIFNTKDEFDNVIAYDNAIYNSVTNHTSAALGSPASYLLALPNAPRTLIRSHHNTLDNSCFPSYVNVVVPYNEEVPIPIGTSYVVEAVGDVYLYNGLSAIERDPPTIGDLNRSSPVQTFVSGTDWIMSGNSFTGTAGLKSNGSLWTWGKNDSVHAQTKIPANPRSTYTEASYTSDNLAVINSANELYTSGSNTHGQLGTYSLDTSDFTNVSKYLDKVNVISGNENDTLVILTSGELLTIGAYSSVNITSFTSRGLGWRDADVGEGSFGAIKNDGTLWMWGTNNYGQLGDGTITIRTSPVQTLAGGNDWKQVSCGEFFTTAIKNDGSLWVWGKNSSGQLGFDDSIPGGSTANLSSPRQIVAGDSGWRLTSSGKNHTAAIKNDGTLWTWGYNAWGALGDGTRTSKSSPMQTIAGGTTWVSVSAGYNFTVATKTDGTLWTWGLNSDGQLGDGTTTNNSSPVQTIAGGTNWKEVIATNSSSVVAIKTDSTLWRWGSTRFGGFGVTPSNTPLLVESYTGTTKKIAASRSMLVVNENDELFFYRSSVQKFQRMRNGNFLDGWDKISLGEQFSVALKTDSTLWSWGKNDSSQLGNGKTSPGAAPGDPSPTMVKTVEGWDTVNQSNELNNSAIRNDGTLWSWGQNTFGALGDGTRTHRSSPVQIITGGTWKGAASGDNFTAAIKSDGTLWTVGRNNLGQLGDGTSIDKSSPVQTIAAGTNWKQISSGVTASAAIKTDGTLWMWGQNNYGQLGDNTQTNRSSPVQTTVAGPWRQVCTGGFSNSAITTSGRLYNWGANYTGQLGLGWSGAFVINPTEVISGGNDWDYVANGNVCVLATKTDGSLWVWGFNTYGGLGDGTLTERNSPVQTICGGFDWKLPAMQRGTSAAIKKDGTLWTWGENLFGQCGDGTTIKRSSPVQTLAGGNDWKTIGTARYNLMATKTDGSMWLIGGSNGFGQLGDGTQTNRSVPVQISENSVSSGWAKISAGRKHAAAIKSDGSLWTWGADGELGEISKFARREPTNSNNWASVSAGDSFTSAIKTDGTLWNWGFNTSWYPLGRDPILYIPMGQISGTWTAVSSGRESSTAIKSDGTLWTWGANSSLPLFDTLGNEIPRSFPVQVPNSGTGWIKLPESYIDNCSAIKSDGTLWTWGNGIEGQLGHGRSLEYMLLYKTPTLAFESNFPNRSPTVGPTVNASNPIYFAKMSLTKIALNKWVVNGEIAYE